MHSVSFDSIFEQSSDGLRFLPAYPRQKGIKTTADADLFIY